MAVRTHVRQCETSLLSDWHDDPPHEVRAPVLDLLYTALRLTVLLHHL